MAGRILLLENDPSLRDLFRDVLAEHGHGVQVCSSPIHVRTLADEESGSVAVVDAWGASQQALSEEECREIRELARTVPTIMVTGRTWAETVRAEDLGLVAIVRKPLDVFALGDLVAQSHRDLARDGARIEQDGDGRAEVDRIGPARWLRS